MSYALETNGIPHEKSVFYIEDYMSSETLPKQARAASNYWNVKSVVENCFDEGNIGKEAWLMTADGKTSLSVTLTYTGTDSRYTIASQEVSFYFYEGSDLFNDDAKEQITDTERFVGTYMTSHTEKSATITLTAPQCYPYTTNPYYTFYVVIKVKFENGGTASVAKNIGVSRAGVLILHGLNDSSSTFQPLKNYLVNTGQFISSQILTKDYSATNTSSFYANTHQNQVVKIGLSELSNNLFNIGIASTKFDMVGHSMGGILERLYNQEIDNEHTNKLITLNTPHFGAPLGNVAPIFFDLVNGLSNRGPACSILKAISDYAFNPNGGRQAVSDLAIGSSAINNLNSSSASRLIGIPVFAVGTFLSDIEENDYSYTCPTQMTDEAAYLMSHIFYNDVPRKRYNYLLDNIIGDGIVSLESQRGGLNDIYCSMFSDAWKGIIWSNAFHCNSPKWDVTQNEIRLLLLSDPDADIFCFSGFGNLQHYNATKKFIAKSSIEDDSKYVTDFVEPKETSYIQLNISSVSNEQYTHTANISTSNDMTTTMVFAILSENNMIADYDKNIMNFNLDGYDNEITFYAIGRTNYNALVMDSVKVALGQSSGIENIHKAKIKYTVDGNHMKIYGQDTPYDVIIWDMMGRVLLSQKSDVTNTYSLPTNNGLLIVGVRTEEGLQTFKIKVNGGNSN